MSSGQDSMRNPNTCFVFILLPQQHPQGNKILDKGVFGFYSLDFGGKIKSQFKSKKLKGKSVLSKSDGVLTRDKFNEL